MSSVCDSYWSNDYHEYRDLGSPPRSFHLPPIVTKIWGRWGRETGSTNRIQSLLWEVFIRQGRKWPRVSGTGSVFPGRGTIPSTPISMTMVETSCIGQPFVALSVRLPSCLGVLCICTPLRVFLAITHYHIILAAPLVAFTVHNQHSATTQ